ncbi:MAG: hypothetical protein ACPGWR_01105 [Ardenticatenaceae bacterium]
MTQAYVVTENQVAAKILEGVLPKKIVESTSFVVRPQSPTSTARSIVSAKRRPVALVMDTHTRHEGSIYEQEDLIRYISRSIAGIPFELFFVIPELEIVFFQDRPLLEQLLQRKVTDVEWAVGHFQPQNSLSDLLKNGSQTLTHEELLDRLTDDMIEVLQQHYPVREISEFLCSVVE